MSWLYKVLPERITFLGITIARDKLLHFVGGFIVAVVVGLLLSHALLGLLAGIITGILKEVADKLGYGTPDIWDAVVTGVGSFVGYLLLII